MSNQQSSSSSGVMSRKRKWGTIVEEENQTLASRLSLLTELSDEWFSDNKECLGKIDSLLNSFQEIQSDIVKIPTFAVKFRRVIEAFDTMVVKYTSIHASAHVRTTIYIPGSPTYSPSSPSFVPSKEEEASLTQSSQSSASISTTVKDIFDAEHQNLLSNALSDDIDSLVQQIIGQMELIDHHLKCWKRESISFTLAE